MKIFRVKDNRKPKVKSIKNENKEKLRDGPIWRSREFFVLLFKTMMSCKLETDRVIGAPIYLNDSVCLWWGLSCRNLLQLDTLFFRNLFTPQPELYDKYDFNQIIHWLDLEGELISEKFVCHDSQRPYIHCIVISTGGNKLRSQVERSSTQSFSQVILGVIDRPSEVRYLDAVSLS